MSFCLTWNYLHNIDVDDDDGDDNNDNNNNIIVIKGS